MTIEIKEAKIAERLQQCILSEIGRYGLFDWTANDRKNLSVHLIPKMEALYKSLDWDIIRKKALAMMEEIIAEKIVNHYITEFTGDIKKSMANAVIRKELRETMQLAIDKMLQTIRGEEVTP